MTEAGVSVGWILLAILGAVIGVYYLYKRGKLSRLKVKGIRMTKVFEPKAETQIERLRAATEKELTKAEELRSVLEAKTELAKARAENIRLQKEIDGVSEKSIEKDKRETEREEQKAQEAQKVKPRRL